MAPGRRLFPIWCGVVIGALGPACQSVPTPAAERAAIVAILDAQVGAWNRGDLDRFMAGYWRSPELCFTSGGRVQRGFEAIRARYRAAYPDRAAMGQLSFDGLEVQLLHPDGAWVLGHWHLRSTGADGAAHTDGGVFTLVFQRIAGEWRIVHDHTSVLVAPAAPSDAPSASASPPDGGHSG